ncbi:ribonuclease E-like [Belonocnema kinseyi]|uniref:ribonuclease E-like n=1 Tax=Belonocnema kinseyi TaxID=2817044 RepID=UPI00143D47C0|nr:ribonuclease E-like [Belonocnema kinseyi]
MLPPCQRELYQHVLRSHFIACTWGNADLIIPNETTTPEQCGWKKENSTFEFVWFEGPQWPARIKDVIINAIAEDDDKVSEPSETLGTDEGGDTETTEDNEEINGVDEFFAESDTDSGDSDDADDDETETDDDDV